MPNTFFRRVQELLGRDHGAASDLATRFRAFQAVLDGNNRTLEAMTEMGEKLGGDYLFDVNYTRSAYDVLFAAVSDSLRNFNLLTDQQYPQLKDILTRIDGLVQRMLTGSEPVFQGQVLFYPEITWDLAEEVGGKNYHLAELANILQLRVPEAFAITTAAFSDFIRHNDLAERLVGLGSADKETLEELRTAILAGSFPEDFSASLTAALKTMRHRLGREGKLAVRSSADEEDGDFSFAGQFETVLNVPCTVEAVQGAYKEVLASLFQANATSYQRQLGYDLGKLKMAVGCVAMIEARASGVIYTAAAGKDRSQMAISAAWGLGPGVVDGLTDADLYTVAKEGDLRLIEQRIGSKAQMVVNSGASGVETQETPVALRGQACLCEAEVLELARQALAIERYYKIPQDIEWAMDNTGRCYFLQARSLRMDEPTVDGSDKGMEAVEAGYPVLLRNKGIVVQRGITAGKVFILRHIDELEHIPKGSILVARHDSSHFVQAIPILNAIITDIGVPTSHMASICREFNIPTVVNTGSATEVLQQGQVITLQAGERGEVVVYAGIVQSLLREERLTGAKLRELYEFRRQKYIMRYIAPLNLVNPLEQEYAPEKCKTVHDLVRFMHEKSVQTLVANAGRTRGTGGFFNRRSALHLLVLPIPVQIKVIDLGGGLSGEGGGKEMGFAEVASVPLRAVLSGMLSPGVWQNEAVPLRGADLLSGMTRAEDLTRDGAAVLENVALASAVYVNMSLRFGYHFNMLDCYCSDTPRNNHIYFRFVGGAAAITNRSRRIALMDQILAEYGFALKAKGDLLVGRLSGQSSEEIEGILEQIGRLIGYTRQLDARLDSDEMVRTLAQRFLQGDYRVTP
ncbi:MAG: PEP-utilizing enzyme [Deltaproteobacteria bacterium]|nr:PEP-utilizing enzyme [Deltaproteobacteria bacterium]